MKRKQTKFYCIGDHNQSKQKATFFVEWSKCQNFQEVLHKASTLDQNKIHSDLIGELLANPVIELTQSINLTVLCFSEIFKDDMQRLQELCFAFHRVYTRRQPTINPIIEDYSWKILRRLYAQISMDMPLYTTKQLVIEMEKVVDMFNTDQTTVESLFRQFSVHTVIAPEQNLFDHAIYKSDEESRQAFLQHYSSIFKYSDACNELLTREERNGEFFNGLQTFLRNQTDFSLSVKSILEDIPDEMINRVFEETFFDANIKPTTQQLITTWFTNSILSFELRLNEPSKYFTTRKFSAVEARSIVGDFRGTTVSEWKENTSLTMEKGQREDPRVNPMYKKLKKLSETNLMCKKVMFLSAAHTFMMNFISRDEPLVICPYQVISEGSAVYCANGIKEYLVKKCKYGVGIVQLKNQYVLFYVNKEKTLTLGYRTKSMHRAFLLLFVCILYSLTLRFEQETDRFMKDYFKGEIQTIRKHLVVAILKKF